MECVASSYKKKLNTPLKNVQVIFKSKLRIINHYRFFFYNYCFFLCIYRTVLVAYSLIKTAQKSFPNLFMSALIRICLVQNMYFGIILYLCFI